jgi:hypothetical protein
MSDFRSKFRTASTGKCTQTLSEYAAFRIGAGSINIARGVEMLTSGAKARDFVALSGTAKAVPFPRSVCETSSMLQESLRNQLYAARRICGTSSMLKKRPGGPGLLNSSLFQIAAGLLEPAANRACGE